MGKHKCIFHSGEQGSPEWFLARLGKITASRFCDVMTNGRGKAASKTSESYMIELVGELLTGEFKQFVNAAVEWGSENEDRARQVYTWRTTNAVKQVGLATIEDMPNVGASSDGLIDDDGIIEIKCPYNSANHLQTILDREMPKQYEWQVQGQLWVLGREWCDFVSFDPRMPETHRMAVIRVERDDEKIETLAERIAIFRDRLSEMVMSIDKNACELSMRVV
jgi:putative phage-type endonuclease